jgi:hypothetical protein
MAVVPGGTRASLREQLLRRKPVAASKTIRNSSVPAVVVPRGAAAELADQAVRAEAERA